jgi:hypothetical protein
VKLVSGATSDGARVELDGAATEIAALRAGVAVDPGPHVIRSSAPGVPSQEVPFTVAEGETRTVTLSWPDAPAKPSAKVADAPVVVERSPLPWVVIGVGATSIAVGSVFGGLAFREHARSCDEANTCEPEGLDRGRTYAGVSTWTIASGAALVAGGIVWRWLDGTRRVDVATSGRAVSLTLTF